MPIHDWTRVDAGTFHDFHQDWTIQIRRTLNAGLLPAGYFAMADQRVGGPEPDVIALQLRDAELQTAENSGGIAVAEMPPKMSRSATLTEDVYTRKANRISIRNRLGRVVAIIEILSPGNKESKHAFRSFVSKVVEFLRQGIHVQLVDLFPPTPRDPAGIHHAIWAELTETPLEPRPEDKPLTATSYDAGDVLTSYFEPLAVGDELPDAPLFLEPGIYIPMPLEATYDMSWDALPEVIREFVAPVR